MGSYLSSPPTVTVGQIDAAVNHPCGPVDRLLDVHKRPPHALDKMIGVALDSEHDGRRELGERGLKVTSRAFRHAAFRASCGSGMLLSDAGGRSQPKTSESAMDPASSYCCDSSAMNVAALGQDECDLQVDNACGTGSSPTLPSGLGPHLA